jgi:hypothetical protein
VQSTAAQIYRKRSFRNCNIRGGAYVRTCFIETLQMPSCKSHTDSTYSYKKGDLNRQSYLKTKAVYDKFIRSSHMSHG